METRKEDTIEEFIRRNRREFETGGPSEKHAERFVEMLNRRIKHFISIVPYLIRVAVATVLIFVSSVIIWNNFIRKDRNETTLKHKISLVIQNIFNKR